MWFRKKKETLDEDVWLKFNVAMKSMTIEAEKTVAAMKESGKFLERVAADINRATNDIKRNTRP